MTIYGAEFLSSSKTNINVQLAARIERLKQNCGLCFFCHPLGGLERYLWSPSGGGTPPEIYLPDTLLPANGWRTSVCLLVSKWIDPDDDDDNVALLSAKCLYEELDHANYLSVETVVIKLKHILSPHLAATLRRWLNNNTSKFRIWVILPTTMAELVSTPLPCSSYEVLPPDVWSVWRAFHTATISQLTYDPIEVGLRFCDDSDEEFFDEQLLKRWRGEMFTSFWLSFSLFFSDRNKLVLNPFTRNCLQRLYDVTDFIVFEALDESEENMRHLHTQKLVVKEILSVMPARNSPNSPESAIDVLQIPLEPLIDNLSSTVYETFEQDIIKYNQYGKAIKLALLNITERMITKQNITSVTISAMVLGAGRGPLVSQLLSQYNIIKQDKTRTCSVLLNVWAVEKNPSAVQSLRYKNVQIWKNSVRIIPEDIRNLPNLLKENAFSRPDLVISEMLGSFGDNELSPECLIAVQPIFHADTISIPQSYQSFAAPAQSAVLHSRLMERHRLRHLAEFTTSGRNRNIEINVYDCLYVSVPRRISLLNNAAPIFQFIHPVPMEDKCSCLSRQAIAFFLLRSPCALSGFSGFFHAELYRSISLNTIPGYATSDMVSWAPGFLPLRKPIAVHSANSAVIVRLTIKRCVDDGGLWYEWQADHLVVEENLVAEFMTRNQMNDLFSKMQNNVDYGELQNNQGFSHYIRR